MQATAMGSRFDKATSMARGDEPNLTAHVKTPSTHSLSREGRGAWGFGKS